ncbi:hypothetical protein HY992_03720 [Candidatus Micrarchaeota archaeon]|nr:hypothetical protein [Candidatus Micrarchaeota archaeon]
MEKERQNALEMEKEENEAHEEKEEAQSRRIVKNVNKFIDKIFIDFLSLQSVCRSEQQSHSNHEDVKAPLSKMLPALASGSLHKMKKPKLVKEKKWAD